MKSACWLCSIWNIWYEGICLGLRRNSPRIFVIRVGYAGFARPVQFSQPSTPGPCFFESHNQVQSALNCFNLTSGWANIIIIRWLYLMAGTHFNFCSPGSLYEGGETLSHSLLMTQQSMAVSCFPSGFQSSARQQAMKQPKLFSKYWDAAGDPRTSCTNGRTPTQTNLWYGTSTWGYSKGCLWDSNPYLYPSLWAFFCKRCNLENTFSVHKLTSSFSHTNLWERQVGNSYCTDK